MKISIIITILLSMAVITGCSGVASIKQENQVAHETKKNDSNEKTTANKKVDEPLQEIDLDHLKIKVSGEWSVNKGLDSAAFSINGKPAGIIEGLPYADSIEDVFPNHTIVTNQEKLTQLSFEAYKVTTTSDTVQSGSETENHIYIFVEPKKEIYDLHYNVNSVSDSTMLKIVSSAEIIDTN